MPIIKRNGNDSRYHGQKFATLVHVRETQVAKLSAELIAYHGGKLPRGTAIICIYEGDFGLSFIDIIPYGSARLIRLEKSIGTVYEIEDPKPADINELPLFKNTGVNN